MSGHSHWAGIKHKKEITDQKRGRVFSKLLRTITIAAKGEPNPDFNPRLRTAVETARAAHVPADSIKQAMERTATFGNDLEEVIIECYGPGGAAIIARAITNSKNRTVAEVKKIVSDHGGKWAELGAVRWAFGIAPDGTFTAKFPVALNQEDRKRLAELLEALRDYDDIATAITNATEL